MQKGAIRVWGLEPGSYKITTGVDTIGDDEIHEEARTVESELWRGAAIPVSLPSQQLFVVDARQIDQAKPLKSRPDVGIVSEDAHWNAEEGVLTVRIHNIGCVPVSGLKVALRDESGITQIIKTVEHLEAPLDFVPKVADLKLTKLREIIGQRVIVELDPDRELLEITRANNRIEIELAP